METVTQLSSNRTSLELKLGSARYPVLQSLPSNRTSLELKREIEPRRNPTHLSSNRTSLELKRVKTDAIHPKAPF